MTLKSTLGAERLDFPRAGWFEERMRSWLLLLLVFASTTAIAQADAGLDGGVLLRTLGVGAPSAQNVFAGEGLGDLSGVAADMPQGALGREPRARLIWGAIQVGAGLDAARFETFVRARQARLRGCYELALGKAPRAAGLVTLRLTVTPSRRLEQAKAVLGGSLPPDLAGCLERVLAALDFAPAPSAPVPVTVSFELTPAGEERPKGP